MRIYVNGIETVIATPISVNELIAQKGLNPDHVVIEYNMDILPREKWKQSHLQDEDRLEIIAFVGGG